MSDLIWDFWQQQQIGDLQGQAANTSAATRDAQRHADLIERRLDGMLLTTMAMWEIMQRKLGVSDRELLDKIREIDLRDGKLATEAKTCAKCGRVMSTRHQRCIYCGGEKLNAGAFDSAR